MYPFSLKQLCTGFAKLVTMLLCKNLLPKCDTRDKTIFTRKIRNCKQINC